MEKTNKNFENEKELNSFVENEVKPFIEKSKEVTINVTSKSYENFNINNANSVIEKFKSYIKIIENNFNIIFSCNVKARNSIIALTKQLEKNIIKIKNNLEKYNNLINKTSTTTTSSCRSNLLKNDIINTFIRNYKSVNFSHTKESYEKIIKEKIVLLENEQDKNLAIDALAFILENFEKYQKLSSSSLESLDFIEIEFLSSDKNLFNKYFNSSTLEELENSLESSIEKKEFNFLIDSIKKG